MEKKTKYKELSLKVKKLERKVFEYKQVLRMLRDSEKKHRNLFENVQAGVFRATLDGLRFLAVNKKFSDIVGYSIEEMLEDVMSLEIISPNDRLEMIRQLMSKGRVENFEVEAKTKNGDTKTCLTSIKLYRRQAYIEATVIDITRRKKTEEELKKAHNKLSKTNELLQREIEERKQVELVLREREKDLKSKANDLQEANAALKVLLKQREEDKVELQEKVISNVKKLIDPYLKKLEKTGLNETQKTYFNIVGSNLQEIISPFTRKLSSEYVKLTPTEIQVANLVKLGKTTKEIAELMRVSGKTVENHRNSIRKKLGIRKKKINLNSHLLSFT